MNGSVRTVTEVQIGTWVVRILIIAALLAVLLAGVGVLLAPRAVSRLHFLAAVTTVALPLFCLAGIVQQGVSSTSATLLLIGAIGALSGPVMSMAIGRLLVRRTASDDRGPLP